MNRQLNRLSVTRVKALKDPGRHADGGGLYLRITGQGAKAWVFMATVGGRRQEIGLGPASSVSLLSARTLAIAMREAVALGSDPRAVIAPVAPVAEVRSASFGEFAEEYITSQEAGWRNPVHRRQWRQSLRDHAKSLTDLPIGEIGTDEVLAVLQPIWMTKSETASRVRGRIERILDAAKARGARPVDSTNPAQFRGHLAVLLAKQPKLARGHHAALGWRSAPTFMAELRQREALSARALEFTILTAARSGETLGAEWGEIDLEAGLWTVPAGRMKASVEHVVPLSLAAVTLLKALKTSEPSGSDVVFSVQGARRSNMAMAQLLKRMKYPDITTHGFRSTFRDWAGDATEYPRELIEQALAHTIGNKAERAYRRGKAIDRRRELMEAWAQYLADSPATATSPDAIEL
jgi:integrase